MAAETARAIRISNERIRVAADRIAQTYNLCRIYLALASPTVENWPALFDSFNAKDPLPDGSDVDGRMSITPESIKALLATMQDFVDFMDANTFAFRDLVFKIAVNPERS